MLPGKRPLPSMTKVETFNLLHGAWKASTDKLPLPLRTDADREISALCEKLLQVSYFRYQGQSEED